MALSSFLKVMESISNVKKQETILPIAGKTAESNALVAIVSPLKVGDDLSLRSSLMSPVNYDREITKLLHKHSEIIRDGKQAQDNFELFQAITSNIDKLSLLWALYKTTYETLGSRQFICNKENCKSEFKQEILLDQLIQEDTFTLWEEEQTFDEYIYPIEIPYDDFLFIFETRIPSIRDNNRLMSNLSIDKLQGNYQSTGSLYSRAEQMALLIKSIAVAKKDQVDKSDLPKAENIQEMLIALNEHIPQVVSEEFFSKYRDKFDKYSPKFHTKVTCPACQNEIDYNVDLETEFFRRSLLGRGEGSEEL